MVQPPDPRSKPATAPRAARGKKVLFEKVLVAARGRLHEAASFAEEGELLIMSPAAIEDYKEVRTSGQSQTSEEHEAEQIFTRVHSELAIEEAMTQRLLTRYGL